MLKERHFNLILALLFFVLCGRFYVLGWDYELNFIPNAPLTAILFKDFLVALLYGALIYLFPSDTTRPKKFFFITALMFGISLLHVGNKGISIWGQHYVRNILYYMFFYVVGLSLPLSVLKKKFQYTLLIFTILNAFVCLLQLVFQYGLYGGRVIGIVGDPITCAFFVLLGWFLVLEGQVINRPKLSLLISFMFAYVLDYTMSLSVIFSFLIAVLMTVLYRYFKRKRILYINKPVNVIAVIGAGLIFVVNHLVYEGTTIQRVYEIVFQPEGMMENNMNAIPGRLESAEMGIRFFINSIENRNWLSFLFGDFRSSDYMNCDNPFSVMFINWGAVGLFLFVCFLYTPIKEIVLLRNDKSGVSYETASLFFILFLVMTLFNSVIYKFPTNIMSYLFMGILSKKLINTKV